jgi:hypothetical protein
MALQLGVDGRLKWDDETDDEGQYGVHSVHGALRDLEGAEEIIPAKSGDARCVVPCRDLSRVAS